MWAKMITNLVVLHFVSRYAIGYLPTRPQHDIASLSDLFAVCGLEIDLCAVCGLETFVSRVQVVAAPSDAIVKSRVPV